MFYEQDVKDRVVEMGLTTTEKIKRTSAISSLALFLPQLTIFPAVVYFYNGVDGFWNGFIHLPEGEMTDEQLLQYIDHEAKYLYTMEETTEQADAEQADTEQTDTEQADNEQTDEENEVKTFEVSAKDEETLKQDTKDMIQKIYGEEVNDSWIFDACEMDWSETEGYDESWDGYQINWSESDAPNAKTYQITIPKKSDGRFIINRYGMDVFASCEDYTWEEAQEYLPQGEETVKKFVKDNFGLGEPDRIEYGGTSTADGEPTESAWVAYKLYYGDDYVVVHWLISTNEVNSIMGKNLCKLSY